MAEGRKGAIARTVGLTAGPAGLVGTLLAPLLADFAGSVPTHLWTLLAVLGVLVVVLRRHSRRDVALGTAAAVLGLCLLAAPALAAMPGPVRRTLAAAVLMATWWITVAIPIPATSLLPLVLFPVLGVMPSKTAAAQYANNSIFLFTGGFIIALGIQRWGLHRRIALVIVRAIGANPSRMVLGFMVASAFLSMWISNTATTLMMLPIALAVIASLREVRGSAGIGGFAPALLLGVAHAATIGGIATKIGTPPNISFARILKVLYPDSPEIAFSEWLFAFLPIAILFLPLAWIVLTRVTHRVPRDDAGAGRGVLRDELRRMGPMSPAERRMLVVFGVTALLWIFRGDIRLGDEFRIPGWSTLVERWIGPPFAARHLHDATVAMGMAIVCFLLPGDPDEEGRRRPLMDWPTARKLPWGILLLFGGGFALAKGFADSGLSRYLGDAFAGAVEGADPIGLVAGTCLLLTYLTEVTSNTATTEVILPVLAETATAMSVNPLLLMLPATISASCAFMLPVATPPNAIVFGSGEVEMRHMVRTGTVLNILGVILVTLCFYFLSSKMLGLDLSTVPGLGHEVNVEKLTLSRERVNGFRLMTQALSPRLEDTKLALASAGWMPARETAYLSMESRVEDFTREHLDKLVLVERSFLELGTVRGQSYLVSREMAPAALRSPCPALREGAERDLKVEDVDQIDRRDMQERVIETLSQGPMTVKDLNVWFSRGEGRVAKLLADPSIIGAMLTILRLDGRVARTNPLRSLDRGPSMYVTTETLLEGEDPSQLEPLDALRTLCAYYFRVHGPATRADFGWWSGAGRTDVAEALASHRRNLVDVEIEGIPFQFLMPASRADELVQFERTGAEPVLLTPFRDPWLSSHEGKAGRVVRTADLDRIVPGPALPAVLIGGMVAGRWWLDTKDFEVRFEWFRPPAQGVEERAERRGFEIAAFAKREMETLAPLAVPGPEGDVPVYE